MNPLKLQTPVEALHSHVKTALDDKIMVMGSCFAENIGQKMAGLGFDVCVNPFGTLYNPVSVCNSLARLASGIPFHEGECVEMGAGTGMICSFSHHTSFARKDAAGFLKHANASLAGAAQKLAAANRVLITLGTAWCHEHAATGEIVSNCLKRDAKEFRRRRLPVAEVSLMLRSMVSRFPGKGFIFTVSPIRHLKDGAHGNQLSKSTLLLAIDEIVAAFPDRCDYFPAYEIVMDELRDYRFYAADMVHPSGQTVDWLWERFKDFAVPEPDSTELENRERACRHSQHRNIHPETV